MKKLTLLSFFNVSVFTFLLSQIPNQDTAYSVVTISPAQSFYLDSRIMSNLNGRSRLALPVNLPEGIVRWYYSFAATESKNESLEWVGLAGQLTKLIDKTGIASEVINRLVKPTGTSACDIFMLDTEGVSFFEQKEDKNLKYDKDFSRQNMTGGTVEVWTKNYRPAIGLSNPSLKTGIVVKIEITAVVAKSLKNAPPVFLKQNSWSKTQKGDLWTQMEFYFDGKKNNATEAVILCTMDSLTRTYSFEEYAALTEKEKHYRTMLLIQDCFEKSGNQNLGMEMGEVALLKKQRDTLEQAGQFAELLTVSRKIVDLGYPSVYNRLKLVRAYLLNGRNNEAFNAVESLSRQLPDDLQVNIYLAHAYLFKNQYDKAEKVYTKFKNRQNTSADNREYAQGHTWEQMVGADFKFFIEHKIFNSRYDNIKKKLKIKD